MDTRIDNGQLFKKVNDNWLLFPKPSEHLEIMHNTYRVTGYADNKKTFEKIIPNKLMKNYFEYLFV